MDSSQTAGITVTPTRLGERISKVQAGEIVVGPEPKSDYPRAIVTRDGTLLATYAWSNGTTAKVVTKASNDQGVTWLSPVDVMSLDATKGELNNPFLFQRSSGELLCAYRRFLRDENGRLTELNLDVSQSTDRGQSWSKIGSIVSEPAHVVKGEWEPFLREAPDGALQAYYSHEFNVKDQDLVYRTSTDGGKTWSDITTVAGAGKPNERPGMPQVINLDDGGMDLLMVYESNLGGRFRLWAQTSSDGGKSWVNPHIIYDSGQGHAGGPGVVQLPGLLVVSFMTNEDQPHQDYSNLEFVDMKVITSDDAGATWSQPIKVISQAGWGGVTRVGREVAVLGATHEQTCVMQKFAPLIAA